MEYNTQKKQLIIPEYGRNVQIMVDYCKSLPTKEERNLFSEAIIDVMGNLSPYLKNVDDFEHKLWDQLYIMADYDLDVDSPYPKPSIEEIQKKPNKLSYNKELKSYRYYGKIAQDLINVVKDWEEGDEKDAAALAIANQMKKAYVNWNKDNVDNQVIIKDLEKLSDGKLTVKNPEEMVQNVTKNVQDVARKKSKNKKSNKR